MAKKLQLRRGTTSQHSSFTGDVGECTVDTDKDTLVVHDNSTQGGFPLARENLSNVTAIPSTITATTQATSDNSTKIATTAYVTTAIGNISTDSISEGNSSAEIVDGGTGHFKVVLDGDERLRIESANGNATLDGSLTADGIHFGHGNDTSANTNVAIGIVPLENSTSTSGNNIGIGNEAGRGITDAAHCIFLGFRSGQNGTLTGDNNIGIGNEALQDASSGFGNVAIGREAAQNLTTGDRNVFIGSLATSTGIVTGDNNVSIGQSAGLALTSGESNVIIGSAAGAVTTGDRNIIIGNSAGQGITTGSSNTIIGGPTSSLGDLSSTMVLGIRGTERVRCDSSGRWLLGHTASRSLNADVQIDTSGDALEIFRNTSDAGSPRVTLTKSRGSTASPGTVSNDDGLGEINFRGWDGNTFELGGQILASVNGSASDGAMPGRLTFTTTPTSSTTPVERVRIDADGSVTINETGVSTADFTVESNTDTHMLFVDSSADCIGISEASPSEALDVRGNIQIGDGNNLIFQNNNENQTVSINADDATASYNITLPPTAPTAAGEVLKVNASGANSELEWGGAGKVLQCAHLKYTNRYSVNTTSFVTVSNFFINFTPISSTSTIIVQVVLGAAHGSSNTSVAKIVRDSTDVMVGDSLSSALRVGSRWMGNQAFSSNHCGGSVLTAIEDSPGTSLVAYKLQVRGQNGQGGVTINQSGDTGSASDTYGAGASSSMVIWEISS